MGSNPGYFLKSFYFKFGVVDPILIYKMVENNTMDWNKEIKISWQKFQCFLGQFINKNSTDNIKFDMYKLDRSGCTSEFSTNVRQTYQVGKARS